MVKKFRVSLALQPIATAMFACSPFTEGKPNGFLSARSNVWLDTDRNRTGMLPFVFEHGMSFERYVDYALAGADVLRLPQRQLHRRGRRLVPRLHGGQARGSCRASGRRSTTGRITSPRCSPRCA